MSALYWSLAPTGEHPAKARSEDVAGDEMLEDNACEAFLSAAALAASGPFMEVLTEEEDPAPKYEIVSLYGDSASKRTSSLSEGVYLICESEDSRAPLLEWLEGLLQGKKDEKSAAERALKFYRSNREAWEA